MSEELGGKQFYCPTSLFAFNGCDKVTSFCWFPNKKYVIYLKTDLPPSSLQTVLNAFMPLFIYTDNFIFWEADF